MLKFGIVVVARMINSIISDNGWCHNLDSLTTHSRCSLWDSYCRGCSISFLLVQNLRFHVGFKEVLTNVGLMRGILEGDIVNCCHNRKPSTTI